MAREMKDSGVEWIGEIPRDWKVIQIKRFVHINNGCEINKEIAECDSNAIGVYGSGGVFKYTDQALYTGKAVLFGRKGTLGKPIYVDDRFWAVDTMYFLTYENELYAKFSYYQLVVFNWDIYITKTAIPSIVASQIVSCYFPIPKINEQKKIVLYLDKNIERINNILAKTRASIEEYKKLKRAIITQVVTKGVRDNREMKDSGIEWIGEIPKEWHMSKLKYLISSPLKYGASEAGVDYNEELPRYIRITDITIDNKLKEDGKLSLEEATAMPYWLFDDDILFSRSGATVGKTFLYKAEYGKAAFAGYLIRASIDKNKAVPKFVYYSTLSQNYDIWKNSIVTQATIQNIGADKYSNYIIAMPLLEEQLEIVEYLDNKISEIDKIIQKKEQYLTEIENYKKSLIYEYVTGKKEVPKKYQA